MASIPGPTPPIADRRDFQAEHHGITITDPYHWLRDPSYPSIDDADVLAHINAENDYFNAVMAGEQQTIEELFAELKARQPQDDASVAYRKNGYWYRWRFEAGQQYRIWERAQDPQSDEWELLLNENALADGLEYFSLGALSVSPSGKLLAYLTDTTGGERYTLAIKNLDTGALLADTTDNLSSSLEWSATDDALYVVQLAKEWRPFRLLEYRLGEGLSEPLYTENDTGFFLGIDKTSSERYLIVGSSDHVTSDVHVLDLAAPEKGLERVAQRLTSREVELDHRGDKFYLRTNDSHANFRLASVATDKLAGENWATIIEGSLDQYLTSIVCFESFMVVSMRVDGLDQIRLMPYPGDSTPGIADHMIAWPEDSYSAGLGSNAEFATDTLRLNYESMVTPATVFDYGLESRELIERKVQQIPSGYDASAYRTIRLQATARDGVTVPVSLVYRADTKLDGSAPLYLYGYGAYGIAIPPDFSSTRLSLLNRGFIYAIAHIRGGDDLGRHWYTDGKLDKRTNTFNDFVDVARHLIKERVTSKGKIAIAGGSAGGELMGAVINQAPELFGAVAAHVPFVDVLNTILDDSLPLTPLEWPEWGNPIESKEAFELIQSYSPYDQVSAQDYPPMLVTAGLNDPRVTYWEPAKWVAKLRHTKTDDNLLLLKTNMGAGHGGKSGRFEALRELAEEFAFILMQLGEKR
ncbi:MAG: S9 family peptidase [Pseudomonadaceae bacterium]|nr:S9 family peptidase [Pseudomonadaceae bacterium]